MKIIFILSLIMLSSMAQNYEQGKIDTHGGKYDNLYGKKNANFTNDIACMSDFLNRDKNSTKEDKK